MEEICLLVEAKLKEKGVPEKVAREHARQLVEERREWIRNDVLEEWKSWAG
jgi:hypothetical protein